MGESKRRANAAASLRPRLLDHVKAGRLRPVEGSAAASMSAEEMVDAIVAQGIAGSLLDDLGKGREAMFSGADPARADRLAMGFANMGTPGGPVAAAVQLAMSHRGTHLNRLFPAPPGNEAIAADDRAHFAADPARFVRIRHAYPSEASVATWPEGAAVRTAVINMQPALGMRTRLVYSCRPGSIESMPDHDQELTARIILELCGYDDVAAELGLDPLPFRA